MSAFLVSDNHINFIVNFANRGFATYRTLSGGASLDDPQGLGRILHQANIDSVNYRYAHHEQLPASEWQWNPRATYDDKVKSDLVTFIKALDCLEYQSCECDDWKESVACKAIDTLRSIAISSLPGYQAAPWGID